MRQEYILNKIGNNLRAERNRLGLSQEELAEKAGLQREHISKIERGLIDMRVSATLVPILKALNLEFEKLYKFD
ncbi:MAG: helix-turn-helix transcriptional regulator [Brachyspira sp.]|nr:helix-turn-helix transcriptional regulator [Brachyspira sp.]